MDLELEKTATKKLQKRLRPKWQELRYDEIRHRPYLIGKEKETDGMKVLSLLHCKSRINFNDLKNHIENSPNQSNVTIAVHSDDSTHLFYKCQMGLNSPISRIEDAVEPEEVLNEASSEDSEI
ncbi:hypothetical protein JTE90_019763 [Oedothorax gibbosus]|uniref:tRNA-splicing endonuclease subunit Sen15 domain-containing protein n=1 Tax=Oedothorax gibbosus TaxID=931172 RepID=A0AAV6UP12_9ARAC|nr:hypothetical protein JTE90_019763 [Oedothorax gibbosus]